MFAALCASASAIGPVLHDILPAKLAQPFFSQQWLSSLSIAWMFFDARWLELLVGTRKFVVRSVLLFATGFLTVTAIGRTPNPFTLAVSIKVWELRTVPLTWELRIGKYLQLYPAAVKIALLALAIQNQNDLSSAIVGASLGLPMSMVR